MKTTQTTWRIRRADERGHADLGWLDSRHTFSFASYYDPAHVGFRSLRVINEDRVKPGMGFGTHPHRDMEIFSYVLEGELRHKDSLGNGRELKPGQIQLMGAGHGVSHSEFNPSRSDALHFLQIWIEPRERGLEPSYTEWLPQPGQENASKVLLISPDGRENAALIRQDAEVYRLRVKPGETVTHRLREGRGAWLQVVRGTLNADDTVLSSGDGASIDTPGTLTFTATEAAEALLFDLA